MSELLNRSVNAAYDDRNISIPVVGAGKQNNAVTEAELVSPTRTNSTNKGVGTISYPYDLSTNPMYKGEKVVFFINVNVDSKFTNNGARAGTGTMDIPEADIIKKVGKARKELVEMGTKKFPALQNVTSTVMKRLSLAIALHMPNQLGQNTGVMWGSDTEDSLMLETLSAAIKAYDGSKGAADNFWNVSGAGAKTFAGGTAARMLQNSSTWQRATRITPGNSKQEMQFEGVDFRNLEFNYSFAPRSEVESKEILEIIRMFKYHMLPEYKSGSEFLFSYPSEFQIKYYKGDKENPFIDKQLTAVLTNVRVNYTPDGQYNTFANGMPVRIDMALSFREMGLATKDIASRDGYHGV